MASVISNSVFQHNNVYKSNGAHRLRGMRIRDEFLCPITYDLLRDPVIAADGNTYERTAIETWLAKTQSSPLTGESLEHSQLSPNRTLKKIIEDLINEGGVGLYTIDQAYISASNSSSVAVGNTQSQTQQAQVPPSGVDENNGRHSPNASRDSAIVKKIIPPMKIQKQRCVDVFKEQVLSLTCVGPDDEAGWFQKSFNVTPRGCMGGRNAFGRNLASNKSGAAGPSQGQGSDVLNPTVGVGSSSSITKVPAVSPVQLSVADVVTFKDTNISRQHFEISLIRPGTYAIRDSGSVGGTFLRVPYISTGVEATLNLTLSSAAAIDESNVHLTAEKDMIHSETIAGSEVVVIDNLRPPTTSGAFMGLQLSPQLIFVVGSHVFIVERIDDRNTEKGNRVYAAAGACGVSNDAAGKDKEDKDTPPGSIESVISEVESMLNQIKRFSVKAQSAEGADSAADRQHLLSLQSRLGELTQQLGKLEATPATSSVAPKTSSAESKDGNRRTSVTNSYKNVDVGSAGISSSVSGSSFVLSPPEIRNRRCVITCIAPEASPSVGKSFVMGAGGGIIGRNPGRGSVVEREHKDDQTSLNNASASVEYDYKDAKSECKEYVDLTDCLPSPLLVSVVDIHMSKEHARISIDPSNGNFYLSDGSWKTRLVEETRSTALSACVRLRHDPVQASVNGTWLRLSPESKSSPWYALRAGMEVGVSQMRFTVNRAADTIYEKEVLEEEER